MKIKNRPKLIFISVLVSLGAFVFGYSLVSISMKAEYISRYNVLEHAEKDYQLSLITTLLPIGAFVGTLATQHISNALGQRITMICIDIFACIVIAYQAWYPDIKSLYMTRFGIGLYLGISGTIIPAYLVSISPPQMTGLIGSFNQLLITVGVAVAYRTGMTDISWGGYILIPAYFCIARIVCLAFFKFDTLERHFKNNQVEVLGKYMELFYEDGTVQQLSKLRGFKGQKAGKAGINQEKYRQGKGIIQTLTNGQPNKVVIMALVLASANQLCGINAIIYYAKQIFQHIVDQEQAMMNTYYLGLLQMVVTFASGFMIDNCGRRTLMLGGGTIIVFSLISAFLFDALVANSQKVVIMFIFVHIVGFSLSLGPIAFIYAAEIMENLSFLISVNWMLTITVSLFSQIMIKSIGIGKVFLFFGLCTLGCLLYLNRYMVQSKGRSRDELVAELIGEVRLPKMVEQQERLKFAHPALAD